MSDIAGSLACPRCDKTPLAEGASGLRCGGCKTEFPLVGGIPWLFADPDASLGEWRNRMHFSLQKLGHESKRIRTELAAEDLPPLTRKRLERQVESIDEHRGALRKILEPLDIQSFSANLESHLALRTRLPVDQGIHTYYPNIHRDWCWGDVENEASLGEVGALCKSDKKAARPGETLILGAGACRLAYDVHMQLGAQATIAMDFNPLLLLVAKRVMHGEELELHEFPLAPKSLEDFAVRRKLSAPEPVREGFSFVFGDVLRPPFASERFDTVITPWLIDIVNESLPAQAARINRLLKPDGKWINFGSLAFEHVRHARRYSAEEVLEIVAEAGFARPQTRESAIPYMCSPASRHGRQETVFSFATAKTGDVAAPPRHRALPDWIVTGKEPVPLLNSFQSQAATTRIYSYIMSLIDGRRTIADMAGVLEQQQLMTRREAEPAIRTFLARMYDDAQR